MWQIHFDFRILDTQTKHWTRDVLFSFKAALLGGADESCICLKAARAYIPLLREHIFTQVLQDRIIRLLNVV